MALYVDGAMNRDTGCEAWASVVDASRRDVVGQYSNLFPDLTLKLVNLPVGQRVIAVALFNDVISQQVNGSELLAFIMGLRIALYKINDENENISYIYSDSQTIVQWWSKSGANPKTARTMDKRKLAFIQEAITERKMFEALGGQVIKIDGAINPADLGYHK